MTKAKAKAPAPEKASVSFTGRNPDVLTCIANLSNDEVFTPPELANQMLDLVADAWADNNAGANIWADSTVRFLDPATKSGVFLREITKRLVDGLENEIPDLQERVDHILTKQVFGIGITELTAMLARRSLYCTKWANGEHSIAKKFENADGNIWFDRTAHTWVKGRCKFCGAGAGALDRGNELESHAYTFIHTDRIKARMKELFGDDMQFDVIIGNPPYQLADGGQGASAVPIYNRFVDQAKALGPSYLVMVIPSRWMFGGRGLDTFRSSMVKDGRLRTLVDYADSRQVFGSVDIAGGVCYFCWEQNNPGDCKVVSMTSHGGQNVAVRPLLEAGADFFIRENKAIGIIKKIVKVETGGTGVMLPAPNRFNRQVSSQKPFGLRTYFRGTSTKNSSADLKVQQSGGQGWVARSEIIEGVEWIDKWKVFTSKSSSEHAGQADKDGMRRVLSLSGVLGPGSVVTETYILLGVFDTETEATNCLSYARTRLFRFLVASRTSAQDLPRSAYVLVPLQDFTKPWSDEELYAKYELTDAEIAFIESKIRPMEPADD